jgi:single-strand DNA-binding protein
MFDTYVAVVGTVLNRPEKRLTNNNMLVTSFRIVSNPRHFDRASQEWVDSANLRLRVNCWRRLAENTCASLIAGDPVIVYGRLTTRLWKTEEGETRASYELEAQCVGHDLSRGQAEFRKIRAEVATTVVDDENSDHRVHGELTRGLDERDQSYEADSSVPRPATSMDSDHDTFDDDFTFAEPIGGESQSFEGAEADAMTILRRAGLDPTAPAEGDDSETDGAETDDTEAGNQEENTDEEAPSGADPGSGGPGNRSRRRGRQPVPA